jgi:ADP-heptose:LPS heptosyltransferase
VDFLQLLGKTDRTRPLEKISYACREIIARLEKFALKVLFFRRFNEPWDELKEIMKAHGFEEVVCGSCGSPEYEVIGTRNGFNNVRCLHCGLGFVTPRYSADGRKHFYSWKYNCAGYTLLRAFNNVDFVINEHLINDQILRVISLYKKRGNLVEIGPFGRGLTREAGKRGFECWMLKASGWVYDIPIEGREYLGGNGESPPDGIRFDVVTCLDVLDRIPHPLRELKGINKVTKNDGILLVRVPDFSSTVAEQTGMAWDYNRPWERIYRFDYLSLKRMLRRSGFKIVDVKTELSEGVGYPGAMVIIARKRGFRCTKKNPSILLLRDGARGDVLLTTPLIKALKEKYPRSSILFKTNFPEILSHNPYLEEIITKCDNGDYDLIYNLKYELFPEMNYVEAYTRIAEINVENPQLEFHLTSVEQENAEKVLQSLGMGREKLAVLHPMVADRTKSWRGEGYQHICQYLQTHHYNVIAIGGSKDCIELSGAINLIGKTSIRMAAAIISKADIFFGIDSFPMHLAIAFKVPSVVLFGPTDPAKVLCPNNTIHAVQSDEKCLGCRHDTTPDKWFQNISCRRDRVYCMLNISSEQAINAINQVIFMGKQNDWQYSSHIIC